MAIKEKYYKCSLPSRPLDFSRSILSGGPGWLIKFTIQIYWTRCCEEKYAEFWFAIHSSQGVCAIRAWRCVNNLCKLFVRWDCPVACISAAILSNCTSFTARLRIINFNQPHTQTTSLHSQSSPFTHTPSLQTPSISTLHYQLHVLVLAATWPP